MIHITDSTETPPRGSAPRPIRKSLCGLDIEAEEWVPDDGVVDYVPGESDRTGYFVDIETLCGALFNKGRTNAALYYQHLRHSRLGWTHIQINQEACMKISA